MPLHCPATLLVARSPGDEEARRRLVEAVVGERVLAVVTAPGDDEGRRLAGELDVPFETDPGLASPAPDDTALRAVADLHRGETVVVLAPSAGVGEGVVDRVEVG